MWVMPTYILNDIASHVSCACVCNKDQVGGVRPNRSITLLRALTCDPPKPSRGGLLTGKLS